MPNVLLQLHTAVEKAKASWTGLSWDSELAPLADLIRAGRPIDSAISTFVPHDGTYFARAHHERFRRLRTAVERGTPDAEQAMELAAEEAHYVAGRAQLAAEHGNLALLAAQEGDWEIAIEQLKDAVACERLFGDSPTWGPVLDLAKSLSGVELMERWAG